MDYNEFRRSHAPTTREQLSRDWQEYKKSLTSRRASPLKSPSPTRLMKPRLNTKSPRYIPDPPLRIKSPVEETRLSRPVRTSSPTRLSPVNTQSPTRLSSNPSPTRLSRARPVKLDNQKLTQADLNQMAKGKNFLIIVIYADWCGHCQTMMKKLGPKMKDTEKIKFIEEKNQDVATSFPTVMYYEEGKRQDDLNVNEVYKYLKI